MFARIINGNLQIGLPIAGELKDGRSVSRYDLLPVETLESEGWLPVVEDVPTYDETTQTTTYDGYSVLTDKIIINYKVIDLE